MLKKIFITLILVFAFVLASVYIFRANIKKYAISTILKSFPLPNVALADVNFDEKEGKLKLEEIKVKNPRGYKEKYIMEAALVDMDITFASKPELRLNIQDINIVDPVFCIERSSSDKWNFLEYKNKDTASSSKTKSNFDFIKMAHAESGKKAPEIIFPRNIKIENGKIRFADNFVINGGSHRIDFFPAAGTIMMDYAIGENEYKNITLEGSCNIGGDSQRLLKGNFEIHRNKKIPSCVWEFNAYNVPLSTLKPYLDRYTPFIVRSGIFNMAAKGQSRDKNIEGNYTMEVANLDFSINPEKSGISFLETSVKKLTLYLTNQKGNVVIDFQQKGEIGGEMSWSLGPIAKRAIGLMAIDTVIDVMQKIEKGHREGDFIKELVPKDIPPEVIDIFRGILK